MRRRVILIGLGLAVLGIGGFILRTLWLAGAFRRISPHFSGTCRLVEGPVGPEDITIHPKRGVAFISASDRRAVAAGKPVPGALYAYDLDAETARPVNLTPHADVSFQPHGISLWVDDAGHEVLFVVNHPPPGTSTHANTIEIFDFDDGALVHRATLTDPLLVMPNDLVAVGVDSFYVTNTHRHPPGFMQTVESYLRLSGAQILYYGKGGFRPALTNVVFPNGINVSRDGRTLYVAAMTERRVRVYDRDPATETLTLRDNIFVGTAPDNLEVAADGALWIGAHPKLLRTVAHLGDPAELSPAQVLRITPDGAVKEIYLSRGEQLSASSVAAVRGRRLLIGQVAGNGFLDCLLPDDPSGERP